MDKVFRKGALALLSDVISCCRSGPAPRLPVCAAVRPYRSMPTHGIGRWRHLVPREAVRKKKDRLQMKPILPVSDSAYGTLNVGVSGFDMTTVENYARFIHNLCNRLGVAVGDCYALQTRTTEVLLMPNKGTKMFVDHVLKTHQRVVQLSSLNAALGPVLLEVLLKNQPEGVQLSVKEHTEADFQSRFKVRPELDGLIAQINQ